MGDQSTAVTGEMASVDADVIVIGAGPVGMAAAALLAQYGVSVLVLERAMEPSSEPKAISLDDESLRTFQAAGIIDGVLSIIVPGTGTRYYAADGSTLFHARGPAPYRLGHPFKNPFAQPELERVLREELATAPHVKVVYGANVVGLKQSRDVATVSVAGPVSPQYTASFVIGCDGGRSTAREQLGVRMLGRSHQETWLVMDTLEDAHDERFGMHHGDPRRPHVIVPGLAGRCRYEFLLFPGEGTPDKVPGFELMRRIVAPYRDLQPHQVERAVVYRFHGLNAARWRVGRIFLAGDAAHMMPPFAGQGLNSGIRDVANLSWKLAGVIGGALEIDALDSYESERRPHAVATIRLSELLGRVVMTTSSRVAEWRDARVRDAISTEEGRRFFEEMKYRPAVRFTTGMVDQRTLNVAVGTALPQPRVFDVELHSPRMMDEVIGTGWALIGIDVSRDDWLRSCRVVSLTGARAIHVPTSGSMPRLGSAAQLVLDLDGDLESCMKPFSGQFLLLRPDRVIAAVVQPVDLDALGTTLNEWFVEGFDELTTTPADAVVGQQ